MELRPGTGAKGAESATASQSDEGRYRLLVDAITDYAIYMLSPEGLVASWNAGAERFKGYQPTEIIGEHFSLFYRPEDRKAGAPEQALRIAEADGRFEREGWRVRKDGSEFWAHVIIDAIRSPEGELLGFAKITRDLTERKRAEESLRQSEEQFRLLVQGVTDYAIYMLDRQGYVSSWNAGAQRIKGYLPEEIIGSHFSRFYAPEERETAPAISLATAARDGRFEKEGWRVRKDGTRFLAHVIIDAIKNDDGQIIGFAKITRDITERYNAQRALAEAQETLLQSQKLDAIGQLTGGIAHDFNNLLSAILGSLDLVQRRVAADPKITPLIENAIQAAQRGATLTQRMLAFARKQELRLESVDLSTVVAGMTQFIERSIGPTIQVRADLADGLPAVQTDPVQLENALLNLALNARDAMPEGGMITITGERMAHPSIEGDYVRLAITDTGEGMDAGTAARAAEPFFTTKGVGKGTGLGLPMVHGLAVQSGGHLNIRSKPGQGTTVELWLRVAPKDMPAAETGPAPATPDRQGALRVLAVDDDALVLINTVALLEDLGHEVTGAASAEEAIDALGRTPDIDAVITDYAMPRMTGLDLATRLRVLRPDLPVIIATGYAEMPDHVSETTSRLAKPFTQDELAAALQGAVASREAREIAELVPAT